jgi:FG-GAP-like repeat/FG-GAP repeat
MHSPLSRFVSCTLLASLIAATIYAPCRGEDFALHTFSRQQLTDVYYSEGIAAGDLNRDGHVDLVYGPYWFVGPTFQDKREIYPAKPQPKERYADHFFAWVYDFNADGWNDVLTAGFPGTPAFIYENPRAEGHGRPWPKHQVLDSVCNESPHFTNIVGDDRPELVCSRDGFFGYATFDPSRPLEAWQFHPISEKVAPVPFGHGLGVGDVNGDGKSDLLTKDGWFEQPATSMDGGRWAFHPVKFATAGGAEMHAYDVDGDGDNDVITSLAAHDFGLAWFEQFRDGEQIAFRRHTILGDKAEHNRYGVLFSEPHSVNLADIDGDGLKDIITGKTYWSHHTKSPLWDTGPVVYWFRLVRGKSGVDWVPNLADGESGIGRQLVVHDINRDGLPDIASGGMRGAHVLLHRREPVSEKQWRDTQPKPVNAPLKSEVVGAPAK